MVGVFLLIVGGGGGGLGATDAGKGGGGGAGGHVVTFLAMIPRGSYPVTVGQGGAGGPAGGLTVGGDGQPSSALEKTAPGGPAAPTGGAGGSTPEFALLPPIWNWYQYFTAADLGSPGFAGGAPTSLGGGGGASGLAAGGAAAGSAAGAGANGWRQTCRNWFEYFSGAWLTDPDCYGGGGGGGGSYEDGSTPVSAGLPGVAAGAGGVNGPGLPGLPTKGGGGGGGSFSRTSGAAGKAGGAGGSGVVQWVYPTGAMHCTGGEVTYTLTHTVHTFTEDGIFRRFA